MNSELLRVIVADDSGTVRALLRQWLSPELGFEIVGEAVNGRQCVELVLRLRPAIVVMDMDMPEMNGVEATREIMWRQPTPILIFTSSEIDKDRGVFYEALAAGALDIFYKPRLTNDEEVNLATSRFRRLLKLLAPIKMIRRCLPRPLTAEPAVLVPAWPARPQRLPEILAIAASTGGPAALSAVLSQLPPGFPLCTLVVQHMAAEFMPGFVEWLGQGVKVPVRAASRGELARPGEVLVAPGDCHMRLGAGGRVELDVSAPVNSCRPSADVLFDSVAEASGPAAMGVILTGMGEDGARGLLNMRRAGALTIAQAEESCVVYGMPKAAADRGAAVHVMELGEIVRFISTLASPVGDL
ncbi:MAG TPA: chemotaxis response regulator protein-glutamate methylesterase [Elusimicrobia bacterium]|nr:chemotaxis response regulator protein-glutamate methylesterase [Elusimicrobiota bacterium]